MTDRRTKRLVGWSVRAYVLALLVYPWAFRREFGESMTQVFQDLARDACRASGVVGLAALWMRTAVDLLVSAVSAYSRERRRSMFRVVVGAGSLYVGMLALAAGYGAIRFAEFYEPPAFSRFGATESVDEDALIAAYEQALTGEFGQYKMFAFGAGLVLAIWLGIASALFGLWQRSVLHGAGAFLAGALLTIAALALLPAIWFPQDRYPVGAAWVMGGSLPLAGVVWLLVTIAGRFGPGRAGLKAA